MDIHVCVHHGDKQAYRVSLVTNATYNNQTRNALRPCNTNIDCIFCIGYTNASIVPVTHFISLTYSYGMSIVITTIINYNNYVVIQKVFLLNLYLQTYINDASLHSYFSNFV